MYLINYLPYIITTDA